MSDIDSNPANKLQFWHRKKLPLIIQSEATECGLACLAMVSGFHGNHTNLQEMRRNFSLSLEGSTLLDIMKYAEKIALTSRPLRLEIEDLTQLQAPCILHWDLNHFVVLKSATNTGITIYDPASGEKKLTLEKASAHFTGIALELLPTQEFTIKSKAPSLKFTDFWSKIIGLKSSLILIFTLSIILQLFALVSPYYIQLVIDDVILSADTSLLLVLAIGFSLVLIFEIITNILRGVTLLHLGNLMTIQLGANLFHHLIRLPLTYFEKRHIGDVVSRFSSLDQVKELLTKGVIETLIDGLMALITLIMIFFYSPKLAIIVVVAVLLYALTRILMYKPVRGITEQEIVARAEENSNFMETVRGIQTIKLFGSEVKREGLWQNSNANAINQTIRLGYFRISHLGINRFLFGFETIIVIYLAASLVIQGGFSIGMLFAFMAYKTQFMTKMSRLIDNLIEFKMLGLHFERLADIVLTEKEELQLTAPKKHEIMGKLTVKDLYFKYSDAMPDILNNLSLEIQAGESVAITGPSGCGKSTLLKLLLGLSSPTQGEILIDDIPLQKIGYAQYRSQIAAVMQNDELLSGTVAENITFFENEVDMEYVVYCAELASIHDDIANMPMGYDSLIGDMGSSLSGGQKQRLILARALYKKPKILFMDEATSHLDTSLESDINHAIKCLNMTRVIIAHRKETIASSDRQIDLTANQVENIATIN